jgi:pSer/pThr/pTyr-binding forkhead associated (FHA) protein
MSAAPPPPPPKPTMSSPPPPVTIPPMSAPPAPITAPPAISAPPPMQSQPFAAAGGNTCPACGTDNAPGVRFCGACGKRLDGTGADAPGHNAGAARTMFMHAQAPTETSKQLVCKLVTIDQTGREGMTFTLRSGETLCGRVNGIVLFDDPFVSPTHCKFQFVAGKLKVVDQQSLNGVYLRVRGDRKLGDGEYLRVGRQLFRFETLGQAAIQIKKPDGDDSRIWGSPHPGAFGRIIQILDDGRTGEIRLLAGDRCQLGREIGDIVIPSDGFISGRHCVFLKQGPDVAVQDLGSSNGTYVRVKGEADVAHGDFLLVGNQMLRVEIA